MTQLTGQSESVVAARPATLLSDLMQLTKLRVTVMVVVTAFIGYFMGLHRTGQTVGGAWLGMTGTLLGTALSCMGAAVLNQVFEQDTDARMHRTAQRPLPTGRFAPASAFLLGVSLALLGVSVLTLAGTPQAALLSAATIGLYVWVYTPMKRVSSTSTIIGALPGALPPVIGYVAVTGAALHIDIVLIFAMMFLWQLPHFLAIAWLYREDYARGGFPMLPVLDPDGTATCRQILLGCIALLPLGLMPTKLGVAGATYFWVALLAGGMFLAFGVALALKRSRSRARALFIVSLVYLPVVLFAMLADRV